MSGSTSTRSLPEQSRAASAFRVPTLLVGAYVAVSVLTIGAVVLLRGDSGVVTPAVWGRSIALGIVSVLTLLFCRQAARGSRRGYLRVRIMTAAQVVAIAVIVAIPGAFPLWLKIEQVGCGILLLVVVVLINTRGVRALFTAE